MLVLYLWTTEFSSVKETTDFFFHSGNFTGWGDEGVNAVLLYSAVFWDCGTAVPGHFTPVKGINTVQLYSVVFCIV